MDLITFIRERRLKEFVAEKATPFADVSNGVYKAVPRILWELVGTYGNFNRSDSASTREDDYDTLSMLDTLPLTVVPHSELAAGAFHVQSVSFRG